MGRPESVTRESVKDRQPIRRDRTAIRRADLSLPMKCLLRDGLIDETMSVFDYGCGHGQDIRLLQKSGMHCQGWDPTFCPNAPITPSDVVNLGYVINVIEDPDERAGTLHNAWQVCRKLLAVTAQIVVPGRGAAAVPFGDGTVTRLGTFQKYFSQAELREYVESQLGTDAMPAAPGVFYVFKDESLREILISKRYRRRSLTPRKPVAERRFEVHKDILDPLMDIIATLGRLPETDEFAATEAVERAFGSVKRAFALIRRVTGDEAWDTIRRRKTEDLLVYLALARFRGRLPFSKLPIGLQRDIRSFFGTYRKAYELGDALLFQAGDPEAIDAACRESSIGKLLPNALYVHHTCLDQLSPLLRVYEGCARMYIGAVPDTTLIKLHRFSGKISYLVYPKFEVEAHPALLRGVKVALRTREVVCYDYLDGNNPPVLHRKETFLHSDHDFYNKFSRLTEQEERYGLLDETSTIGTREGWNTRLAERGFEIRGHRLMKRRDPS